MRFLIIVFVLTFVSAQTIMAQKGNGYEITGHVSGLDKGVLKIYEYTFFNQNEAKVLNTATVVDFWASWCMPCRASFPHLKVLRKQYGKDGFTIVGVGTADVEEKWRKAIEEDQTPWIHAFDVNETRSYGPVARAYGVPHLPTTFLIDANRKILLRNPSKEELDAKLKELFGY